MATLPPTTDFTGESVTQGGFKTAMSSLRTFLGDLLDTAGTTIAARKKLGVPRNSVVLKTAAYTAVAADVGKVLRFTGASALTLSLTAATTLGDGWTVTVVNDMTADLTVDPYLSENIDGATTATIKAGQRAEIMCDGTRFMTAAKGGVTSVNGSVGDVTLGLGVQSIETVVFTSSGTWIKDAGLKFIVVEVVGGGGGGFSSSTKSGGGGAGGGMARKTIVAASLGSTETVTVGGGGSTGSTGGTSSFGGHCSATGGAAGGDSGTTQTVGAGSGGDVNVSGNTGQYHDNTNAGSATSYPAGAGGMIGRFGAGGRGPYGSGSGEAPGYGGVVIVTEYY